MNFFRICWFSDHGDNGHSFVSFIIVSPMSLHKIQSFPFIAKFCLKVTQNTLLKVLHNIEKDNIRYNLSADFWYLFRFRRLLISFLPTVWMGLL